MLQHISNKHKYRRDYVSTLRKRFTIELVCKLLNKNFLPFVITWKNLYFWNFFFCCHPPKRSWKLWIDVKDVRINTWECYHKNKENSLLIEHGYLSDFLVEEVLLLFPDSCRVFYDHFLIKGLSFFFIWADKSDKGMEQKCLLYHLSKCSSELLVQR